MAHLIMGLYASPSTHEEFITKVNMWRYKQEGKYRKGKMAPYVSELKLYDIRLPEQMIDQFLTDCNACSVDSISDHLKFIEGKNNINDNKLRRIGFWLIKKILKKLGIYAEYTNTGNRQNQLFGWHNFYVLARLKDDKNKNVLTNEYREVL